MFFFFLRLHESKHFLPKKVPTKLTSLFRYSTAVLLFTFNPKQKNSPPPPHARLDAWDGENFQPPTDGFDDFTSRLCLATSSRAGWLQIHLHRSYGEGVGFGVVSRFRFGGCGGGFFVLVPLEGFPTWFCQNWGWVVEHTQGAF